MKLTAHDLTLICQQPVPGKGTLYLYATDATGLTFHQSLGIYRVYLDGDDVTEQFVWFREAPNPDYVPTPDQLLELVERFGWFSSRYERIVKEYGKRHDEEEAA